MLETTLLLLSVGLGAGFYIRSFRTKAEAENTKRYIDALIQQTDTLRRELDIVRKAESRRLNEEARHKAEAANAKRHADTLVQQIGTLQHKIAAMDAAEAQRLDKAAYRKRLFEENDIKDMENQIKFISQAELRPVRPVNKEAVRVLYALDEWIATNQPGWRMAFEVSMGAFIKTSYDPENRMQKAAFSSYNSKRVDFLLIDRFGNPVLVVEYHGTGHDLSEDASGRMDVKRLALERAGIPLVEVPAKAPKADIMRMVEDRLTTGVALAN